MKFDTEYDGVACVNCVMLICNGDTSGNSYCETEESQEEWFAQIEKHSGGVYWVVVCDNEINPHHDFSTEECSVCGTKLAGDRCDVVGFKN